jgi:carboxyl-terminal processing protease
MRRIALLLLVLVAGPARAQEGGFDVALAARVFAAGLDFVAPRSLDLVTVAELSGWGLHGITALDPALTAGIVNGQVQLSSAQGVIYTRAAPPESLGPASGVAWGEAVAALAEAASLASEPVRRAGTQGVIQSVFDEMFNHLDPYSRYVAPVAADEDRARRSGEAGAGLTLARDRSGIVIRTVNADGSGAAAGLRPGDRLLAVDGQPTRGQEADTVADWVAGDEGTAVELLVRDARGRVRRVAAERAVTPPETVFASRVGDLLLLRIAFFAEDTDVRMGTELAQAVRGQRPVRGAILDLRDNHGGLLRQAVAASELMLGGGLVVTTAGRDPQASHVWEADSPDLLAGRPIVVLVDGRSASAAEIMAAALADRGRAVVTGSATYGKGLVQAVTTLPDGGEMFVSWSRLLAPDGWPLQGLGVLPQVCTSLGETFLRAQFEALGAGQDLLGPALARTRAARPPLPEAQAVEMRAPCPAAVGGDEDLGAARWLLAHSAAYGAALLPGAMRASP